MNEEYRGRLRELLKRMKVLSEREYQAALPQAVLVCGNHSYFADDVETACDVCRRPVWHRPYNIAAGAKLCMECVTKTAGA